MVPTSSNPAIHAYKVYHLSQTKLDKECRRQTPDLHRIVLHASIVDNVRRWSRDLATPSETVVVDSDSDTDSDPFDDSASSEDEADDAVAIFDIEVDDNTIIEEQTQASGKITYQVQHVEKQHSKSSPAAPKRRAPEPPKKHEMKSQAWKQNRPVTVRETAIEVDGED
ncbi:hypothetical protein G647_07765 [Cladophialophora carrionii CBS 160.54]|uniref:Uncharacterized protein n=1 Tax=Cladophialophora carrionii CBS 160.54 TaxID=1279043 RepID=V9D564_9EURO|nr:uncharacterized protein G647_07765 [Cladophialophora carrionii CBS 160.54]ETI21418.1 hypothetical protein G647_07765 [Cladophialophora carrionii CBS 160.54]